jgi:CubicO group peptidase (beta-lactamase class C family)
MNRAKSLTDKRVDVLFSEYSKGRVPGAAVMVIDKGKILYKNCYGLADIDQNVPIRNDTAFLLASVTKPFTAMAVMILYHRKLLRYDDPLSDFFPQFPTYARQITVRHLLNHTSGLPAFDCLLAKAGMVDIDWPRLSTSQPSSFEPTSKDVLDLLARQKKLRSRPGDRFEYDNSGYVVLAQIVENVSGQPFARFVEAEIFRKIKMSHSVVYDENRPEVPNRARSYTGMCGVYREIDYTPLNLIYGEDGIYTTIDDMYQWDQAMEKDKLVKHETLLEAFSPRRMNNGECTTYGFGWRLGETLGSGDVSHDGWWAGFRTYILRVLGRRFTVVVLANCVQIDAATVGDQIAKIYLGAIIGV